MASARKRGRRDNGLDAISFKPLRDVDPRVGEHLLDLMRDAGIAAYLDPTSDVDAVTRSIALPSPPSDRLYVDRNMTTEANALVFELNADEVDPRRSAPSPILGFGTATVSGDTSGSASSSTDDAQWRELVAAYEAEHGRLGDTLTDDFDESAQRQAAELDAASRAELEADESAEEEHYEPPPPPPLPALSKSAAYALVLLTGGALLLIAPGVLGLSSNVGFIFGVLGIASGVGMLVWRMREGPQFEDPDDGAIV